MEKENTKIQHASSVRTTWFFPLSHPGSRKKWMTNPIHMSASSFFLKSFLSLYHHLFSTFFKFFFSLSFLSCFFFFYFSFSSTVSYFCSFPRELYVFLPGTTEYIDFASNICQCGEISVSYNYSFFFHRPLFVLRWPTNQLSIQRYLNLWKPVELGKCFSDLITVINSKFNFNPIILYSTLYVSLITYVYLISTILTRSLMFTKLLFVAKISFRKKH